jgi:hypothetical protein
MGRGEMKVLPLVIELISGAVGGNVSGTWMKKFNLGPIGNSIARLIDGGLAGSC